MLPTTFRSIWPSCFRGEDFQKSTDQKQELSVAAIFDNGSVAAIFVNGSVAAIFVNGSGRNEQSLQRTFHRCFLPSFVSFGQVISEEKIFKTRPIRNKKCLWWPCLLMDRDRMSNHYRGPSIDASYQVSVHLAKWFQRRRFLKICIEISAF